MLNSHGAHDQRSAPITTLISPLHRPHACHIHPTFASSDGSAFKQRTPSDHSDGNACSCIFSGPSDGPHCIHRGHLCQEVSRRTAQWEASLAASRRKAVSGTAGICEHGHWHYSTAHSVRLPASTASSQAPATSKKAPFPCSLVKLRHLTLEVSKEAYVTAKQRTLADESNEPIFLDAQ